MAHLEDCTGHKNTCKSGRKHIANGKQRNSSESQSFRVVNRVYARRTAYYTRVIVRFLRVIELLLNCLMDRHKKTQNGKRSIMLASANGQILDLSNFQRRLSA